MQENMLWKLSVLYVACVWFVKIDPMLTFFFPELG